MSYFYPRSPCGERQIPLLCFPTIKTFLSTLSLRRATTSSTVIVIFSKNFYPRSPCGERRRKAFLIFLPIRISIHALLAESDNVLQSLFASSLRFLSTLSLRRATFTCARRLKVVYNFYPRSPCGERLMYRWQNQRQNQFLSTLSLRRATEAINPS